MSIDEHVTDRIRVIEDETVSTEKWARNNCLLISSPRKSGESVVAHPERELESRQILSSWFRKAGTTSSRRTICCLALLSIPILKI